MRSKDLNRYSNCCRICLEQRRYLKPLLTTYNGSQRYDEIFEFCTGIEISDDSNIMPVSICLLCERYLLRSNELKRKAIRAQNTLQEIFKSSRLITVKCEIERLEPVDRLNSSEADEAFGGNASTESSFDHNEIAEVQTLSMLPDSLDRQADDLQEVNTPTIKNESLNSECNTLNVPYESSNIELYEESDENYDDVEYLHDSDSEMDKVPGFAQADTSESPLECCGIIFETKDGYMQHKAICKSQHWKTQTHTQTQTQTLCPICGKLISTMYFKLHLTSVHPNNTDRTQLKCPECDKTFKSPNAIRIHRRIHSNDKRYECHLCGEMFMHWATRRNHIVLKHTGDKRFKCSVCSKMFCQRANLTSHMKIHTGEKPYKCEECPAEFRERDRLKRHMVTHTKERNHPCPYCGKAFGTRRAMLIHYKIHTGEKNYVCTICSRGFIQNHVLRTHLKTHLKTHPDIVIPPAGTIVSIKYAQKKEQTND